MTRYPWRPLGRIRDAERALVRRRRLRPWAETLAWAAAVLVLLAWLIWAWGVGADRSWALRLTNCAGARACAGRGR